MLNEARSTPALVLVNTQKSKDAIYVSFSPSVSRVCGFFFSNGERRWPFETNCSDSLHGHGPSIRCHSLRSHFDPSSTSPFFFQQLHGPTLHLRHHFFDPVTLRLCIDPSCMFALSYSYSTSSSSSLCSPLLYWVSFLIFHFFN